MRSRNRGSDCGATVIGSGPMAGSRLRSSKATPGIDTAQCWGQVLRQSPSSPQQPASSSETGAGGGA